VASGIRCRMARVKVPMRFNQFVVQRASSRSSQAG
jgi:hypothetical protein